VTLVYYSQDTSTNDSGTGDIADDDTYFIDSSCQSLVFVLDQIKFGALADASDIGQYIGWWIKMNSDNNTNQKFEKSTKYNELRLLRETPFATQNLVME
jgi:hypothetical protein